MSKQIKNEVFPEVKGCNTCDVNICETAGFVDLATRFKRMEQSGYVAHFFREMFDTNDERQIYLGDETEIYAGDDDDTIQKKLYLQAQLRQKILQEKLGDLAGANDESEPERTRGSNEGKSSSQRSSTESVPEESDTNE